MREEKYLQESQGKKNHKKKGLPIALITCPFSPSCVYMNLSRRISPRRTVNAYATYASCKSLFPIAPAMLVGLYTQQLKLCVLSKVFQICVAGFSVACFKILASSSSSPLAHTLGLPCPG